MAATKKILIVDDDADLRETLREQLWLQEEYTADEAGTGAEGLTLLENNQYEVVLLDVGLPDIDGRDLCRKIRRLGVKVPIIMLTGADSEADTILGLESGANDYVTKPFKFGILSARIRAHLRQHEQSEDAIFTIGPYSFHPSNKLLVEFETERKTRLTEKETSILKYLLRAKGKAVGRTELLNEVWGYNSNVTTHTLETHVYRLRQKIELNPSDAKLLLTEPGGYRLEVSP